MKKEQPQMMVSVIVRAYMREKFIRQALDSVLAQQTSYPFEIIIGYHFAGTYGKYRCSTES